MNLKIAIPTALLTTAAIGGLTAWQLPAIAHNKVEKTFKEMGITKELPKPEKRITALRYKEIDLDDDKDSIETLALSYSFPKILTGQFDHIIIDGLALSGEFDQEGAFTSQTATLSKIPATRTTLKNANFSTKSPEFGGVIFFGDMELLNAGQTTTLTGTINTDMHHIKLGGKINGQINENGTITGNIAIESGGINRRSFAFSRSNGTANFTFENAKLAHFDLNINAGGFSAYRLPWQNLKLSFDGIKGSVTAESLGVEGVTLSLNNDNQDGLWRGTIKSDSALTLEHYLYNQSRFPDTIISAEMLQNEDPIEVNFTTQDQIINYTATSQAGETAAGRLKQLRSSIFVEIN